MPRGVAKANLPTKVCIACGRPFAWRKAWARDWEAVRYCSDGCRRHRPKGPPGETATPFIRPPARPPG